MSGNLYANETVAMDKSEWDRRKAAGECQTCAWPADRNRAHKTIDCLRLARKEVGTAPFPKAKEYQKLKVGSYGQKDDSESEIDLYTTDEEEGESEEEKAERESEEDKEEGDSEEDEEEGESEEDKEEDEPEDELQEEFSARESEQEESVCPEMNWWDDHGSDSE